ncbi:ubiquitin-like protein [Trypanosoma cruzi]|nr:ubiquitin-like protein [Trypanosoma cruzi]
MEEGEANRSGTQGSTACTYGESGPSCLHPSRRVRTHKKVQRTQQHKSKVTIKKKIPAHHADCWSTGSAANIHHKATLQLPSAFVHIHRTQFHAGPGTTTAAAAHVKTSARNAIMQAAIYLCFCLDVGRCLHAFFHFFAESKPSCLHRVFQGFPQGAHLFFPLVNVSCVGAANNSVCVVPAFRW